MCLEHFDYYIYLVGGIFQLQTLREGIRNVDYGYQQICLSLDCI